jgi:hypothetical protein
MSWLSRRELQKVSLGLVVMNTSMGEFTPIRQRGWMHRIDHDFNWLPALGV